MSLLVFSLITWGAILHMTVNVRERCFIIFDSLLLGVRLPNVMTYVPPLTAWIKANTATTSEYLGNLKGLIPTFFN